MAELYDALQKSFMDPVMGMGIGLMAGQNMGQGLQQGLGNSMALQAQQFRQQQATEEMLRRAEYLRLANEEAAERRAETRYQQKRRQQQAEYIAGLDESAQPMAQAMGAPAYAQGQMQKQAAMDAARMSAAASITAAGMPKLSDIRDYQKTYTKDMEAFKTIQSGMRNVGDMMSSGGPAADQAILNYFLKTLLPNEAIMESDVGRATNLAGLQGKFEAWQKQLSGEGQLPEDVKQDMYNTINTVYGNAQEYAQAKEQFYQQEEQRIGTVPGRITGAAGVDTAWQPEQPGTAQPTMPQEPFDGYYELSPEEQEEALQLLNMQGAIAR